MRRRAMTVLIVTPFFPVSETDPEGSFVRDQALALALLGEQVDVAVLRARSSVTLGPIGRYDASLRDVFEMRYLPYPLGLGAAVRTRALRAQLAPLRRIVERRSYCAAIIHDELAAAAAGPLLDRWDVPWVVVVHGLNRNPRMLNPAGERLKTEVYRRAARVIRVGPGVGVPAHVASEVVPNGATFLEASGAPAPPRTAGSMVLSVSGLRPGKGIEANLRALAALRQRGIDVGYWIAGDGPLRQPLQRLAADLDLAEVVRFLGTVPRDRLGTLLAACDFFSLPSSPEAYGIAYLEAMLHAKPVIACRGEGPESFVEDGENGLLVPPGDLRALTEAWRILAEDPDLRAELGRQAVATASTRTWRENAARIQATLRDVAAERPAPLGSRRLLWLGVEPTAYMEASVNAVRDRLDAPVVVAYVAGGGDVSWRRLCRDLATRRGDALVLEGWGGLPFLLAMTLARIRRLPYVVGSDTYRARGGPMSGIRNALKRLLVAPLLRHAAVLLPGGTPQARYVRALIGDRCPPVVVAHMTVDTGFFSRVSADASDEDLRALRATWGCADGDVTLLFAGRLEPWKGVSTLLDAVGRLPRGFRLVVFGAGSLQGTVDRARGGGLPIHYAGHADTRRLALAYAAADVLVLPSMFEPWGLVVNEAMAAGLPCVVSDRVGAREDLVEEGVTGSVFPAGDADALADRLRALGDAGLRARLGAAGHDRVMGSWSLDVYANSLARALQIAGWGSAR